MSQSTGGPNQPVPQTRFSADWAWWWDGAEWKPAISPDRLWRWDGQRWVPAVATSKQSGAGTAAAGIAITVLIFMGVLVFVSIIVIVVLYTMGNQIANVFSNVTAALGP